MSQPRGNSDQITQPQRKVLLKRPNKTDILIQWNSQDVTRHMNWVEALEKEAGITEWFDGLDGTHLLDILHDCPSDIHDLMSTSSSSASAEFDEGREDDDITYQGRQFRERRLKPIRQQIVRSLQLILGDCHPRVPQKKLHKIMLERRLFKASWVAAARRSPIEDAGNTRTDQYVAWNPFDPASRQAAACILNEYGGERTRRLSNSLMSRNAINVARELTRSVDALRFALPPSGVAAAYAYQLADTGEHLNIEITNNSDSGGPYVFQLAVSNLASILIEVTRALWGSQKSILIVGESDRRILDGTNGSKRTLDTKHMGAQTGSESSLEFVEELLRLLRSVINALSALCPPKTSLVSTGHNGIGGDVRSTVASGEARQRLEIVCNECLNPLVFLLAHVLGGCSITESLKKNIESTIRAPFAFLLYLLQWHEDNLVSLFAAQKHMIVRAALHWLSPNANPSSSGDEQIVRRNLVTVIWSFAKKKERAAELATPEMLHPLLQCLDMSEKQRDVRFTAAGALEYLLTHRVALLTMPMTDVGSTITGTFVVLTNAEESVPELLRPPLFDAVFDKLRPTLSLLFGAGDVSEWSNALSSGYLQLTLAACANLAYLSIASAKEHPIQSEWLRQQLQTRLAQLVDATSSSDPEDSVDSLAFAAHNVPEFLEPRVRYEAMRLLWALLRLRIHPQNRNGIAYRSLLEATSRLDIRCASAGVVFDNVPPHELKLHFIRDLLHYVCNDTHDERGTETLRAFAIWILAHHTTRKADLKHISSQRAFVNLAQLVADDNRSSLFRSVMDATKQSGQNNQFFASSQMAVMEDKLLTMRLIAHCMSNLARSELTASAVIEQSKLGQTGPLHALNRLTTLGWLLSATATTPLPPGDASAQDTSETFLSTGEHQHRELASHETWLDNEGRRHHKCIPYVVRINHNDSKRARVRQAATDERIHFLEPSTEYAIRPSFQPLKLDILNDAALAIESLAAHNHVRSFFASHGTLSCVVGLALHRRFSSSIAFKVLLDTPRTMLVKQVAIARVLTFREQNKPHALNPLTRSHSYVAHGPRWLLADINELILSTLESAPTAKAPANNQRAREEQVAALLALQLATSILAQDDNKEQLRSHSQINDGLRGKQVVVHTSSTGELVSGVCLRLLGYQNAARTAGIIDVVLDSGEFLGSIPAKHTTMPDLLCDVSPISMAQKEAQRIAYFVHPSDAGTTKDETSLILYFVREADRYFGTLMACSENVVLTAAACNLCETLSNTLRRYLAFGEVSAGEKLLEMFSQFCGRQLSRLVGDCACAACVDCPNPLLPLRDDEVLEAQNGQLHICLYLLQTSVSMYRAKKSATCSHRGFKFGIPTLMHNAISSIHALVFDSTLGELTPSMQRHVTNLFEQMQPSSILAPSTDPHHSETGLEHEKSSLVTESEELNIHKDDVRSGNNLLNSAFRALLAVLELAKAVDEYHSTVLSESQPILLGEMLRSHSQKKFNTFERACDTQKHVVRRGNDNAKRGGRAESSQTASQYKFKPGLLRKHSTSRSRYRPHDCVRRLLVGRNGARAIETDGGSPSPHWNLYSDDAPFHSKLRELCCQVVGLGLSSKNTRVNHEHYAQNSAIRSSLRLLSALGPDLLLSEKVNRTPPTLDRRFVHSLIKCIKCHPYWHRWHALRKEGNQKIRSKTEEECSHAPKKSDSPAAQNMGDLLALEACKLVQLLSTNLNQRHRMVFPDAPGKNRRDLRNASSRISSTYAVGSHDGPTEEIPDDTKIRGFENEIDAAMKQRSKNGCLPILSLLIGAGRCEVDLTVRSAAVAAVKEIAINSTICSEAICAHDGVKNLVVAAHVGDHSLRRNVAFIFSLIAMMPSTRGQLLKNYRALLLLLQLQAVRDNLSLRDTNHVVASAGLALKYLSEESALVNLKALELCVKRVEIWNQAKVTKHESRLTSFTVGIPLLGHGYRELLGLALKGLDNAASHSETASLLIDSNAIDSLIRCLCIREAGVLMTTAVTLAALANHLVAHEKHHNSSGLVCRVIDNLLHLVWPFAHRAARTLQSVSRQRKMHRPSDCAGSFLTYPLGVTLAPVTSTLVGLAATTIERAACDHGLGDYLVQKGAMEALVARLTPDAYKHDEDMSVRTSSTTDIARSVEIGNPTVVPGVAARERMDSVSLRSEPPVVQVLSAIAQLAHNAPHCHPSGKTERTLSIVCAFHHSKRCRHLAMLALWRIRPAVATRSGTCKQGNDESVSPPPPIYWDEDDVVTWLGCIGFGSLGKAMRKYVAHPQNKSNIEILNSVSWTQSRCREVGWTRSKVEQLRDPYGQATAGEKVLALTGADLTIGGRLNLLPTQRATLELHAFAAELRELHLRMREFLGPLAYDIRLPQILLERSDACDLGRPENETNSVPEQVHNTTVILTAAEIRRYRALLDEAKEVCRQADPGSGAVGVADLVHVTVGEARQAYAEYEKSNVLGAKQYAQHAKSNAEKIKDAVALHRVKHSHLKDMESEKEISALDDVVDRVVSADPDSGDNLLRWGDTLWYELSSAPSVEIFNRSRDLVRDMEHTVVADESNLSHTELALKCEHRGSALGDLVERTQLKRMRSSGELISEEGSSRHHCTDVEDACLWPTEGHGFEAAQVRELKRRNRRPTGLLQKVSKAPIWDRRGLAHLYEVRFIDARMWLPGHKTALMMCAKEGDSVMVSLLLDNVDVQVKEHKSINNIGWGVFECLPSAMRPDAVDGHGNTALHHALFSLHRLLRMVSDCQRPPFEVADRIDSQITIIRTLIERVALPHGAEQFSHGIERSLSAAMIQESSLFEESNHGGAPRDSLAVALRCYSLTQNEIRVGSEQSIDDEKKPLTHPMSGMESVARKLDDMIKLMFECHFTLKSDAIRVAEAHPELLARVRYMFVEYSRPASALKHVLEVAPDLFLKGRFASTFKARVDDATFVAKLEKSPWEAPVFALKRLQKETNKLWMERMIFIQNRQLLGYVGYLMLVLYVTAEIVGMDMCIVSRDTAQQALRTRFVDEEWEPANGFLDVATPDNWWSWAEGPLLSAIYEPTLTTWQNNGRLKTSLVKNSTVPFPLLGGLAFAVGQPVLRMLGTKSDESYLGACAYNPGGKRLQGSVDSCFSFYDESVGLDSSLEWQSASGLASAARAFDYANPALGWLGTRAPHIYGYQAYYPGVGGYVAAFPRNADEGEQMLRALKNSSWLSQNTRAIVLDFMVYSPSDHHSFNLITRVRLLAEFTPTGAVLCSGQIRAVRLWLYRTFRDFVRAAFEVGWVVAVFLQFWGEVTQLAAAFQRDVSTARGSNRLHAQVRRFRTGIANYASVHFNVIDLGHFHVFLWLICVHAASLAFTSHVDWNTLVRAEEIDQGARKQLSTAATAFQMAEIRLFLLGIYVFLTFLKFLDRMRVRESLHVLIIEEMFKKIFTFLIVMSVCVLGFSFTAFASRLGGAQGPMGGHSRDVGGGDVFVGAFVSQMRQLIGEIDYETAYNSDPRFGIVFCIISFMVLPVLLMNLLVAIMLEAYERVRDYAAARFCYLQLAAYSDYFQVHDGYMGVRVHVSPTHWLALAASATLFPILVLDRIGNACNRGAIFIWRDFLYPKDGKALSKLESVESFETIEHRQLATWTRALKRLRTLRLATFRIHPS